MQAGLADAFRALTGHERPFSWQWRLLTDWLLPGRLPDAVDLPTGLGKTSVMALWLIALARQMREGAPRLPRRLVYVVDRRAVVDQATEEAAHLREALLEKARLRWMAEALGLRDVNGRPRPLPVSALRGRLADNREWLADPSLPAIIVGTVDMIGSRLLFSGYGVSRRMRPYHAGLLGVDTLVLLDEAHLVPPFERLLATVAVRETAAPWHTGALWPERKVIRPLKLLPLSATHRGAEPAGEGRQAAVFSLSEEAVRDDEIVRRRLHAPKRLEWRSYDAAGKESQQQQQLTDAFISAVRELLADEREGAPLRPRRVIVYCDRRSVAQKVFETLRKEWAPKRGDQLADLTLFTGARRVFEREAAAKELRAQGFLPGGGEPGRPAILVATSAAEVGVDLDADDLVCDLVPLERMIQRFGRVNRRGARDDTRIIALRPEPLSDKAPHAAQRAATLRLLNNLENAAPADLQRLLQTRADLAAQAMTPPPLHPPLTLPVVESWALTNLRHHTGRPDIQPWLRGWVEDERPQAEIIWRAHLPWPWPDAPRAAEVERFFAAARPHLLEVLEATAGDIADVLIARAKDTLKRAESGKAEKDREQARALSRQGVILLSRANECVRFIGMEELAARKSKDLAGDIAHHRVVAPAALGGLDAQGLLDKKAAAPVLALDDPRTWPEEDARIGDGEELARRLGFRVSRKIGEETRKEPADGGWVPGFRFDLAPGADESPEELVVELWRGAGEAPLEGDPAITRSEQALSEHLEQVAREAEDLAGRLDLSSELREILRIAAGLHDLGKRRPLWQIAMNGDVDAPKAKTRGGGNGRLLAGYRHEFGSVSDVRHPDDAARRLAPALRDYAALPEESRALALHLIAAHHGNARPLMPPIDPERPPSALEERVRAIALRFARLQRRFGPWGLAWLEALLRAADQRASARLDAEAEPARPMMEAHHG